MARLKISRFKAPQPPPDMLAEYLLVYDLKALHFAPETLPPISPAYLFGSDRPMVLDLGCGRGDFLIAQAAEHPDQHFVGFDLHWKSLWDAIRKAHRAGLRNVKFIRTDLRGALRLVPDECVSAATMLFPPPIIQPVRHQEDLLPEATLRDLHRVMIGGAPFHLVTDHAEYFEKKRALVESTGLFSLVAASRSFEGGVTWFQKFWETREIESLRFECRKEVQRKS